MFLFDKFMVVFGICFSIFMVAFGLVLFVYDGYIQGLVLAAGGFVFAFYTGFSIKKFIIDYENIQEDLKHMSDEDKKKLKIER